MDRRKFLKSTIAGITLAALEGKVNAMADTESDNVLNIDNTAKFEADVPGLREFLEDKIIPHEYIDYYLNPDNKCWSKYDPELAYVPKGATLTGGVDGSLVFMNYGTNGERKMLNFPDKPCRVNTYGNSFTEGIQASDGETWQEYLAAHFGEPVRNFGVGGYGVYQAYRRMLRMEEVVPAEYIIFNVWIDDHYRSLHKMRGILWKMFPDTFNISSALMFHSMPWVHLEVVPETGEFVERENEFSTPESLYKLCDREFVYNTFKNDFTVQMMMAQASGKFSEPEKMKTLCRMMGIEGNIDNLEECRTIVPQLHLKCALKSSMYVIDKAVEFAGSRNKKLLVLLSYDDIRVRAACKGQPRMDQPFVDYLVEKKVNFIDCLQKHVDDYKSFNLTPEQYTARYYNGHYKPIGNLFFAFAIKNEVVNWLDPKPPAYRGIESIISG